MAELFIEFLGVSWRYLPWLILTSFVLAYLSQIAGLKSGWLIRRPKLRKGKKRPPSAKPGIVLLIGFLLALVTLALAFAAYHVNIWLSLAFQAVIGALLLDTRDLFDIGDKIAYLMGSKKMQPAGVLLSRFVGRNSMKLNGHEMIGLTMNTSKAALAAASVGPLFALMIGGAPLGVLVKAVLAGDWKRRDPLAAADKNAAVRIFFGPSNGLAGLMLRVSAAVMGFVLRKTPVSGVRYMLSDLERNNRHLLIASVITMIVCIDILLLIRLVLGLVAA